MGYSKAAFSGAFWTGGYRLLNRVIAFIRTGIMARILTPTQFGVYGVGALVLAFLETFISTGINTFLIQNNRDLKKYVDTAWFISIIRGFIISLLLFVSAPFVSVFFKSPDSLTIIRLLSLSAIVRGFINPSIVSYQKQLLFKKESILYGVFLLADSFVAITLAFIYRSPTSIVWGLIASATLEMILSFVLFKPKPKFNFEISKAKEILGVGKWMIGTNIFAYLYQEGDDVVVGRLMDSASLGYYRMAYKISTLPITEGVSVFQKVTFPIFTNIKNDKKRLKNAYFKSAFSVFMLSLVFGIFFLGFSEKIVYLVLGEQWLTIVPVLRVLSVYGIIQSIAATSNSLFYSTNNQKLVMIATSVNFFVMALTIYPLIISHGILGAGMSALLGTVVSAPVRLYFLLRYFKKTD